MEEAVKIMANVALAVVASVAFWFIVDGLLRSLDRGRRVEGPDEHGSMYVNLAPGAGAVVTTESFRGQVFLDYDLDNRLIGIELLGIAKGDRR